jgi:hypothetical protein
MLGNVLEPPQQTVNIKDIRVSDVPFRCTPQNLSVPSHLAIRFSINVETTPKRGSGYVESKRIPIPFASETRSRPLSENEFVSSRYQLGRNEP